MKIILIILFSIIISSCALGVGVYTAGVESQYWNRVCVMRDTNKRPCDDKNSILTKIGKPSFIQKKNDEEIWRYKVGLRYVGFAPVVTLIPIPIMLPVGLRYGYIHFDQNGVLKNANKEFNCQNNFTYLGIWITDNNGYYGLSRPRNGNTCSNNKID